MIWGADNDLTEAIVMARSASTDARKAFVETYGRMSRRTRRLDRLGVPAAESRSAMGEAISQASDTVTAAIAAEIARLNDLRQEVVSAAAMSSFPPAVVATADTLRVPEVVSAEHHQLTGDFNAYGDDNTRTDTWTGSDSTYAVELPDGRTAWIVSDTFLGTVEADGSRRDDTDLVPNAIVIQDGKTFTTLVGGTAEEPRGLLDLSELGWPNGRVAWAGATQIHDGTLEVLYRVHEWSDGWHYGNVIATFDLDDLRRAPVVRPLDVSQGVLWGSAVHRHGGYTYVYGTEDRHDVKYLQVARIEGDSLTGSWEFLTDDGTWSADDRDAHRRLAGVANEFSVTPMGDAFLLVTHDTTQPYGADIVGFVAPTPYGPFVDKTVLYTTPETGADGVYGDPGLYTYNAQAHPHIARDPNHLMVSYSVHGTTAEGPSELVLTDVSVYRPRFVTIEFG